MICFYHRKDLDGWCSAAIVKHFHPDVTLIPMEYDLPFPWEMVSHEKDHQVIMVDFSLKIPDMVKLAGMCDLVWIDHHITILADARKAQFDPQGIRLSGTGACVLTWQWCSRGKSGCMDDKTLYPIGVWLLGEYDVGQVDVNHVLEFEFGMRTLVSGPESPKWEEIFNEDFTIDSPIYLDILKAGVSAIRFISLEFQKTLDMFAFKGEFEGYPALFLNSGVHYGLIVDSLKTKVGEGCEVSICYVETPEHLFYSIVESKNPNIHCGVLCQKHGGGGHADIGGFRSTTPPYIVSG